MVRKIKLEVEMLNNTALRAGAQSANNTHMACAREIVNKEIIFA